MQRTSMPCPQCYHYACCVCFAVLFLSTSCGDSCSGQYHSSAEAFSVVALLGHPVNRRTAASSIRSEVLLRYHPTNEEANQYDVQSMEQTKEEDDEDIDHSPYPGTMFLSTTVAAMLLNVVAIIWGSQHALIKTVVEKSNDPSVFNLLRFGLSAIIASPYTPRSHDFKTWRWGIELGIYMFLGFCFQSIGLEYTTAQRSGFLLYLNVKFVPFLGYLLFGRTIQWTTIVSAITAFTGTALLGYTGNGENSSWNVGDAWSIAAAVASALFILRLEDASKAIVVGAAIENNNDDNTPNDSTAAARLNAACLWTVAILAAIWTSTTFTVSSSLPYSIDGGGGSVAAIGTAMMNMALEFPFQILYLGGIATALANFIQTRAQSKISAERASIIYAMDPVYGAVFAYWILGETLDGPLAWIGAALIVIAAAGNALVMDDDTTNRKIRDHQEHQAYRKDNNLYKDPDDKENKVD